MWVFGISRTQKICEIDSMLSYWNERAKQSGLKGVYYIFQKHYEPSDRSCLKSFDAEFQFQPFEAIHSPEYSQGAANKQKVRQFIDVLPEVLQKFFWSLWTVGKKSHTVYQYDKVWQQVIRNSMQSSVNTFPGAFVDWDNTARYGNRATIFSGATPARFKYWFGKLVEAVSNRPVDMNYIFLNAWNEWAECAYIEPDEKYGYQYLEAIQDVLSGRLSDE